MTTDQRPAIVLTGPPGVGKSTAIQKIIRKLGSACGGFYTREIREKGQRTGFEIVTLEGPTSLLATRNPDVPITNAVPFKVFRVNLDAVELVALPALLRAAEARKLLIIDEIGPMEIFSEPFCRTVLNLFNNPDLAIVGTAVYRPNRYANQIKKHPRAVVKIVSRENRDNVPDEVLAALAGDLKP